MKKSIQPDHKPSSTERMVAGQLSAIGLMIALIGLACLTWGKWVIPLFLAMMLLTMAIVMFIQAGRVRKASPHIMIALIALGLTIASFAWQSHGPLVGQYGTECETLQDCIAPLIGGGLPIQYVIDVPGISFQGRLGNEDEFHLWAFVLDICFYMVLGEILHRLYMRYIAKQRMGVAG